MKNERISIMPSRAKAEVHVKRDTRTTSGIKKDPRKMKARDEKKRRAGKSIRINRGRSVVVFY